ncbi:MAG: universal stress protein [Halobacteriaceae archaeon]
MFETVIIATDGSTTVDRAITVTLDIASRFDADVHALYVVDSGDIESSPNEIKDQLKKALEEQGEKATKEIQNRTDREITTTVREGRPVSEITSYARDVNADLVATGTRGRHGENRFLIGSVAERVIRTCPIPVLTVRHLT